MAKSTNIIILEILEFIRMEGGHLATWCIGVSNEPKQRLFDEHQVHYQDDAWIYRTTASESEALNVQSYFLEYGLDGRKGGRRADYRMVYAYRKGISTKP
jgi:hypothetical protein